MIKHAGVLLAFAMVFAACANTAAISSSNSKAGPLAVIQVKAAQHTDSESAGMPSRGGPQIRNAQTTPARPVPVITPRAFQSTPSGGMVEPNDNIPITGDRCSASGGPRGKHPLPMCPQS